MPKQSLEAFAFDRKTKDCPVCNLDPRIRDQMDEGRKRLKIPRETVLAWLKSEVGVEITSGDLDKHFNGRHEQRRRELNG